MQSTKRASSSASESAVLPPSATAAKRDKADIRCFTWDGKCHGREHGGGTGGVCDSGYSDHVDGESVNVHSMQ